MIEPHRIPQTLLKNQKNHSSTDLPILRLCFNKFSLKYLLPNTGNGSSLGVYPKECIKTSQGLKNEWIGTHRTKS